MDEEHNEDDKDDRPLTSAELIKQAKEAVRDEPDIEGLDDIAIDIPVEQEFPEPIPSLDTRPRQAARPRRTVSAYDTGTVDPFDRDEGPASMRSIIVAVIAAILLISIGAAVFFAAMTGS